MNTRKILSLTLGSVLFGALVIFAGEFPDAWTWDNKPEQRADHAALEGKPMPALAVTGWINGEVKPAELKGKVVVVDFYATWCGPCKRLSPMLDNLAGPLTNRVKFVKVDVDQSAKLARQFGIDGVPTLIFFKDGKVVDRLVGLPAREALQSKLESLASPGGLAAGTQ